MTDSREGTPGTDRLTAFSDGVVAIAITLLILPLSEIDILPGENVGDVLLRNRSALVAFGLSFAVIADYWMAHHELFRGLGRHTPQLVRLNMLWLASIAFLPFPTAMVERGVNRGFGTMYLASLLACSVLTLLLSVYLAKRPNLFDDVHPSDLRQHTVASLAVVGAISVATLVSFVDPQTGMWALLLLIPAQTIAGRVAKRRGGGGGDGAETA